MEPDSLRTLVQTLGVPVAICAVAMYGMSRWILRQDDKAERKDEQHRVERKEDREAHIGALKEITGQFNVHTQAVQELGREIRDRKEWDRRGAQRSGT